MVSKEFGRQSDRSQDGQVGDWRKSESAGFILTAILMSRSEKGNSPTKNRAKTGVPLGGQIFRVGGDVNASAASWWNASEVAAIVEIGASRVFPILMTNAA